MRAFQIVTGRAVPLLQPNIDTDVIIRIERLAHGDRTRLGEYALEALRFQPDGRENPECPLNQPAFRAAPILLAGPNFGCGSSREGAVVALMQMGLRCVVAQSFGDIFYGNCIQNGLLPVRLPHPTIERLAAEAFRDERPFVVDLAATRIHTPSGDEVRFDIESLHRDALLAGLDDIGLTLRYEADINAWQAIDRERRPWVWTTG
jgi:3-isopropylmalate/(R)-2-methylmalate dehydratase small subunit